jgi:hypothetical protein
LREPSGPFLSGGSPSFGREVAPEHDVERGMPSNIALNALHAVDALADARR